MKKMLVIILVTLLQLNIFASAEGEVAKEVATGAVVGAATGAVAKGAADQILGKGFGESVGKFLNSPQGIAILSGVSLGMNTILYNAATEQEVECKSNAEKIQKKIDIFKASFANNCVNGRDNLKEPACYCYLENGKPNQNRSNSDICKKQWAKDQATANVTKGNYAMNSGSQNPTGCVTVNGKFDEKCQCKKLVNSKGQNACMKESQLGINIPSAMGGFAKASGVGSVLGIAANVATGKGDLSNLNGGVLAVNAARARNAALELLNANHKKVPNSKLINDALSNPDKALALSSKVLGGEKNVARYASATPFDFATNPSGNLLNNIQKAESDLKKDGVEFLGGSKASEKRGKKKDGFNFAFNSDAQAGSQVLNLPDTEPEKKYKIKGGVNTNEDASIFDILSNRYMQTGIKHLMDDEDK